MDDLQKISSVRNISSSGGFNSSINGKDRYEKLSSSAKVTQRLKLGIWIYFILIIFEGALRKWVFPGLATPLLIIRDPIAIWIIFICWKQGLLPSNMYVSGMVFIGITGTFTAIFLGHQNLTVAVYGARIFVFHFPLIFIIGRIFNREDVIRLGKFTLLLSIPMAVLVAIQFYSPQSAWVNRGLGGDLAGGGFSAGALGYYRPPATFSFTTGTVEFYSLVACFIIYFLFNPIGINKFLLTTATFSLLIVIPLSISRGLFFQVGISLIFAVIAALKKHKYINKMMVTGLMGIAIVFIFSFTSFFQTAVEVFTARFEIGNDYDGGMKGIVVDRFLGGMISALTSTSDLPFFGYGLGMGTNVGSIMLTGDIQYLISEGEWGRVIGELGPLMGLLVIFFRVGLSFKIALACYRKLLQGDLLPWILSSYGLLFLLEGQWARPTTLGFCVIVGGLMIASLHVEKK